jgi:hypothetical protein
VEYFPTLHACECVWKREWEWRCVLRESVKHVCARCISFRLHAEIHTVNHNHIHKPAHMHTHTLSHLTAITVRVGEEAWIAIETRSALTVCLFASVTEEACGFSCVEMHVVCKYAHGREEYASKMRLQKHTHIYTKCTHLAQSSVLDCIYRILYTRRLRNISPQGTAHRPRRPQTSRVHIACTK